jgi:hypothetical protein
MFSFDLKTGANGLKKFSLTLKCLAFAQKRACFAPKSLA